MQALRQRSFSCSHLFSYQILCSSPMQVYTLLYPSTHWLTPKCHLYPSHTLPSPFWVSLPQCQLGIDGGGWRWVLCSAGWLQGCVALVLWHLAGPPVKGPCFSMTWGMLWFSPKSQLVSVCSAWQGGRKILRLVIVWLHQKKASMAECKYRE